MNENELRSSEMCVYILVYVEIDMCISNFFNLLFCFPAKNLLKLKSKQKIHLKCAEAGSHAIVLKLKTVIQDTSVLTCE